ncbi:MAG: hypothetical protein HYW51_03930 [Candidatus Doudnabacteria bacterium]|nr:hypothetical protein [Candidatus Doudnabacteria bacterium]
MALKVVISSADQAAVWIRMFNSRGTLPVVSRIISDINHHECERLDPAEVTAEVRRLLYAVQR